ncbi:MAG: hypothetical protein DMG05_28875 [Acidobacteria bacterium]|nr:MAG: hypothetical protein DMG05_28875 [Acidobacteriota bacterium]
MNTAIFSFVNAILLRPLPVPDSDRLVSIFHRNIHVPGSLTTTSYPNYEYYRDHNDVFSGLMAFARLPMSLHINDQAERVTGELVSTNYFSVLQVNAAVGRLFQGDELRVPETSPVIVLSYEFWQRRFNADPEIVGKTVRLHADSFTVVGVAQLGFRGTVLDWYGPPQVWVPIRMYREAARGFASAFNPLQARDAPFLRVVGRLKPGVPLSQAQASMGTLRSLLRQDYPETDPDSVITLISTNQDRFWPTYRKGVLSYLGLLMVVVGLVLLMACFNLANLLLAQASKRQKEIAVRLALGAGHGRLMRQLLTESLLLAIIGGVAGLVVAKWTVQFLSGFEKPFGISLAVDASLDSRVLGFALLISLATGVLFGLLPARQATRIELTTALKPELSHWRSLRFGARNILIVLQMVVCLVLLIGTGLFLQTLRNAQAVTVSREPEKVLIAPIELATEGYSDSRARLFYPQLLDRARSLVGVRSAGVCWIVPLSGLEASTQVRASDAADPLKTPVRVNRNVISSGYFRTLEVPIIRGRDFNDHDNETARAVTIVNQEMARRFWPGEDPVGKELELADPRSTLEIVGMVENEKIRNVREGDLPCFYIPLYQYARREMSLLLRVTGDSRQIVGVLRRELQLLDKDLPFTNIKTMRTQLDIALSQERMTLALFSALGLLALTLASIGIFGITSFSVTQRTREIGIRMALGAQPGQVLRMVLRQGVTLIACGCLIGLIAAFVFTRLIASMLFGVSASDLMSYIFASLILAGVSFLPARRATKVARMEASRYE